MQTESAFRTSRVRGSRTPGAPRINARDLVMTTLSAQVANPIGRASVYRVSHDGIPRVLPGSGGITVNHRVGDRCVGLAGDHVEPGASLHNNAREIVGGSGAPNRGLLTLACAGNIAKVTSGPACGALGTVTGKHGGVDHLIVDFPTKVLRKLRIGDTVQIWSMGQGMRFLDHPDIVVMNCAPRLAARWGLRSEGRILHVPVTHFVPASIMGSGIGRPDAVRGDYDIQLFDPVIRRRYRLDTLRFGDIVAIPHADTRRGRAYRGDAITIGIVVHGDSTISGHGPGVVTLLTTTAGTIRPHLDPNANIAAILGIRKPSPPKRYEPLVATSRSRSLAGVPTPPAPPARPAPVATAAARPQRTRTRARAAATPRAIRRTRVPRQRTLGRI